MPSSVSAFVNGEDTRCLDVGDRGLHYGDGVFTTLRVVRGVPVFLSQHLRRLQTDAKRLGIHFPDQPTMLGEIHRLSSANPQSVLKIMLTRGFGGRGYRVPAIAKTTRILSAHPLPDYPPDLNRIGIKARFCALRLGLNPCLAGIKHLNRLEQILARSEWEDGDIREGLMLDYEGFLVEGVMSNVFLVRDGRLRTPLLDRCGVAGVMRGLVIEEAKALGIEAEELRLLPADVFDADEVFVTNSVIGIWPVCELDGKPLPLGEHTRQLARRIEALADAEVGLP